MAPSIHVAKHIFKIKKNDALYSWLALKSINFEFPCLADDNQIDYKRDVRDIYQAFGQYGLAFLRVFTVGIGIA